jgi:hypothetical protein
MGVAAGGAAAVTSVGGKAVGVGDATGAAGVAVAGKVGCAAAEDGVTVGRSVAVTNSGVSIATVAVGAGLEAPWVGEALLWLEQAVIMMTNAQR